MINKTVDKSGLKCSKCKSKITKREGPHYALERQERTDTSKANLQVFCRKCHQGHHRSKKRASVSVGDERNQSSFILKSMPMSAM